MSLPSGTHLNPKFNGIRINPNFKKESDKIHVNPKFISENGKNNVHVNPKFANRALPPIPGSKSYVNPQFIDGKKAKAYEEAIKNAVHVNPKFKKGEKENATPSRSSGSNNRLLTPFSSATKTLFKKIGQRKLVRVSPRNKVQKNLEGTYKVKTNRKIVKKSSPAKPSPSTPLTSKRSPLKRRNFKHKRGGFALKKVLNPFRLDRRKNVVKKPVSKPPTPKAPQPSPTKIKTPAPPKPARRTKTTLINVQGVRYTVSDNGRKLNRIEKPIEKKVAVEPQIPKKLFLEGEEYIEDEPGVLIRSRNSMTRQSITSYKQRSINTILKSQTRSKQYCMFFNKFGKCKKNEEGRCPYIHDKEKVAVCRKFLQANCFKENCLLSHKVAPEKMPVCKYFLEGLCTKDPCPYRHVKVNDSAEICQDFLKGFCPVGEKCTKKHENKSATKKSVPAKPKRKSLGATPLVTQDKKKRYFETEESTVDKPPEISKMDESFEKKRQRILKKVELAKQGWSGMAAVQDNPKVEENLDDSGPYEEIDEDPRPPIGPLPSFISLNSNEIKEDEEEFEERLI